MAANEFTQEWTTLIPQQQCLLVRSEVTVTESQSKRREERRNHPYQSMF